MAKSHTLGYSTTKNGLASLKRGICCVLASATGGASMIAMPFIAVMAIIVWWILTHRSEMP